MTEKIKDHIEKLIMFSPRQLYGEKYAATYIREVLTNSGVKFVRQKFILTIPKNTHARLVADGKKIHCQGCSFVGGKIPNKDVIISSLLPSIVCQETPNINFNPLCKDISCNNFYFAPALAVAPRDIATIINAKKCTGICARQIDKTSVRKHFGRKHQKSANDYFHAL